LEVEVQLPLAETEVHHHWADLMEVKVQLPKAETEVHHHWVDHLEVEVHHHWVDHLEGEVQFLVEGEVQLLLKMINQDQVLEDAEDVDEDEEDDPRKLNEVLLLERRGNQDQPTHLREDMKGYRRFPSDGLNVLEGLCYHSRKKTSSKRKMHQEVRVAMCVVEWRFIPDQKEVEEEDEEKNDKTNGKR